MPINPFPPVVRRPIPANEFRDDPAKFIVGLGRFHRPRLYIVGGDEFEWPMGTENFRLTGNATLAEHRYIGDDFLVVQVTHRDSARIEMTGVFPGRTGVANMRALRHILTAVDPPDFKRLELPGIFPQAQQVVMDNYDFRYSSDNRIDSIEYTVTFVRVGTKGRVTHGEIPESDLGTNTGEGVRKFTVREGFRTLKAIAKKVYGSEQNWKKLYNLNKAELKKEFRNVPLHTMPTKPLPIGMKLIY